MTHPCAAHPGTAAVATCAACGRWCCAACRRIDEDGLARCPTCDAAHAAPHNPDQAAAIEPVDEAALAFVESVVQPAPVASGAIPWEEDALGDVVALRRTLWEGLTRPVSYCARIPWITGELRRPLIFAILCATFGHLASVAQRVFSSATVVLPAYPGLTTELEVPRFVEGLLTAPLFPLSFTILLFASALLAHLLLDVAGAARRPFEATFRVIAYAHVGKVALVVPILGGSVQVCYLVFLVLTGLRAAHGAGLGISALSLLPVIAADLLLGMG